VTGPPVFEVRSEQFEQGFQISGVGGFGGLEFTVFGVGVPRGENDHGCSNVVNL
jgi:hypothetical protein